LPQYCPLSPWHGHYAGKARYAGEHFRYRANQRIRFIALLAQLLLQFLNFSIIWRLVADQRIDEQPVSLRRRNPASGGMRGRNQPEFLQFRHDIANRCGAEFYPGVTR